jgi:hypothetical protein
MQDTLPLLKNEIPYRLMILNRAIGMGILIFHDVLSKVAV